MDTHTQAHQLHVHIHTHTNKNKLQTHTHTHVHVRSNNTLVNANRLISKDYRLLQPEYVIAGGRSWRVARNDPRHRTVSNSISARGLLRITRNARAGTTAGTDGTRIQYVSNMYTCTARRHGRIRAHTDDQNISSLARRGEEGGYFVLDKTRHTVYFKLFLSTLSWFVYGLEHRKSKLPNKSTPYVDSFSNSIILLNINSTSAKNNFGIFYYS